jgi:pimeloyl-ACP methyl ester carboxylesterase
LAGAARGILSQRDSRVLEHLPEIDVPTLIVVGEDDKPFLAGSQYMAAKIPGARLEVIPGSGHSPMTAAPDRLLAIVRAHLDAIWPMA